MAKRDFRTPAQKAKDAAKRQKEAQKAQTAQRKEERKVAATPVTPGGLSPAQQAQIDKARQQRQAVQDEYSQRLRTGDVRSDLRAESRTPEDDLTPARFPNAINYKPQYHDSVRAIHDELATRVATLSTPTSREDERAVGLEPTSEPARALSAETKQKLANVSHHLGLASAAHDMSLESHKAGNHADAVFYLSKAADHLHDAINGSRALPTTVGTQVKSAGIAEITSGTSSKLHTLTKTYADDVTNTTRLNSIEKDIIKQHVATKDYTPGEMSSSYVAPIPSKRVRGTKVQGQTPRMYKNFDTIPLSSQEEEATADRRAKEARDAGFHEMTSKEISSISDPKQRSAEYERLMSERTAKGDEDYAAAKVEAGKKAADTAAKAYQKVKGVIQQPALTDEELKASGERYTQRWQEGVVSGERNAADLRWKRAVAQTSWEQENPNKTFIGSEAHKDPEKWHLKWQVKAHWLGANPKASPEDFENTEFAHSPERYNPKDGFKPEPMQVNPDRSVGPANFRLKDAVRQHWMHVNLGKNERDFEETQFASKPETYSHPGQNEDGSVKGLRQIPKFDTGSVAKIQFPYRNVMKRVGLPAADYPTPEDDKQGEKSQTEINNLRTAGLPVPAALTMHPDVIQGREEAGTLTGPERETKVAEVIQRLDKERRATRTAKLGGALEAKESESRVDQALNRPSRGASKRGATTSGFKSGLTEHELAQNPAAADTTREV